MGMFNSPALRNYGFYERLPAVMPRYFDRKAGAGDRGMYSSLHLLNLTQAQIDATQDKMLRSVMLELSADRGAGRLNGMTSFLLNSVQYGDSEKMMVMPTFGDDFAVYFMGRAPRRISISGTVIDDRYNNWFYKFLRVYDTLLRGTNLARYFRLIALEMPNASAIGVITGLSYSQGSTNDTAITFNMDFLVKSYQPRASSETIITRDVQEFLGELSSARGKPLQKLIAHAPLPNIVPVVEGLLAGASPFDMFSNSPKPFLSPSALNADEEARFCDAAPVFQNMGAVQDPRTSTKIFNGLKSAGTFLDNTRKSIAEMGTQIKNISDEVHSYVDPVIKTVQDTKRLISEAKKLRGNVTTFARTADKLIRSEARILRSGKIGAITGGASLQNIQRIMNLGNTLPIVGRNSTSSVLTGITIAEDAMQNTSKFVTKVTGATPAPSSRPVPTSQ